MGMLRLFLPHCQRSKEGFDLETASVSSFQMGFVASTSFNFPFQHLAYSKRYCDGVCLLQMGFVFVTFLKFVVLLTFKNFIKRCKMQANHGI